MDYYEAYLAHLLGMGQNEIELSSIDDKGEYLEHYQIKGAKHGVRRFQNPDGSLTPAGRERYGVGPPRQKSTAEKLKESIRKSQKKKEKSEAQSLEELKDYLRDHPKQLPKYRKTLTDVDAREIVSKIEFDRKLKDVRDTEIRRGIDKLKDTSNTVSYLSNILRNGTSAYNSTAEIYNVFVDTGVIHGKRWPIVGANNKDKDKSGSGNNGNNGGNP